MTSRDADLLIETWKYLTVVGGRPELVAALKRMIDRNVNDYQVCLVLTREQVERDIPYKMVCEARNSSRWDAFTRKRRWAAEFTSAETTAATTLFRQAQNWTLGKGVPASVRMTETMFDLWKKLGDFCASL